MKKKTPRFEEAMARLQEIVTALEDGDQPLDKGIALYKEGAACARFCREQLEKARHEISVWQEGDATPFPGMGCAEGSALEPDREEDA